MTEMYDEGQILHDVEEAEESFFDIYIRFNGTSEKDYCFQVKSTTTFRDLHKVFATLPIALRPSIFYGPKPLAFRVSTAPGYLTEDGNLLFDFDAEKTVKNVPQDEPIGKHCWPGQLVLPVWDFNSFGFYSFLSFLLVWLYTDLPDFISPTPGICLTNHVGKAVVWASTKYGYTTIAEKFAEDLNGDNPIMVQIFFFVFHILKVAAIFVSLFYGVFNPIKVFRMLPGSVKLNITREELLEIGWTGSRRADIFEYRDYYREYKIQEYGGMVAAHKKGLFSELANLGCKLGEGEGFNTPIDSKSTLKDDVEGPKLLLNFEYFTQLGVTFTMYIEDKDGKELTDAIKEYRRYGLLHSNKKIKEIVAHRKSLSPASDNAQEILGGQREEQKARAQVWAQGGFDDKKEGNEVKEDGKEEVEGDDEEEVVIVEKGDSKE